jgi:SAM-dependent methyltransferase
MRVIAERFPNYRELEIHESSPGQRGTSLKLLRECPNYSSSHYFEHVVPGQVDEQTGYRCESLEALTFEDNAFDLFVTQDVMEHIFNPDLAFKEICRVLKPGGAHIFTVPIINKHNESEVWASLDNQNEIVLHHPAEYHGNPVDEKGSLVTMHWGYDIVSHIYNASGMSSIIIVIDDISQGIKAELIEIVVSLRQLSDEPSKTDKSWPNDVEKLCATAAEKLNVSPAVHPDDFIFRFIYENPVFEAKELAVNYYFNDGRRSAEKVRAAMDKWIPCNAEQPPKILEFASGYGAVTRHAKTVLQPCNLHCCDIHPEAMDFISQEFHVDTIQSCDIPEELNFETEYDLIFVLSFFSHMPERTWQRWLNKLHGSLSPNGVLLFTTHGKVSMKYFPQAKLNSSGYWFEQSSEQKDLDEETYGQTITSRTYVEKQVSTLKKARLLAYEEAGWWEHQDVYIIRKE